MLLPGVGFDVVPTDCLAAHLEGRLPTATHLTLAFHPQGPAALPPGTLSVYEAKVLDRPGAEPIEVFHVTACRPGAEAGS